MQKTYRFLSFGLLVLALFLPVTAQETGTFSDGEVSYRLEPLVEANFPVALAFAPDGRLFYTEKTTGNVRLVMPDGTRQTEPVITLPTDALQERGLLGIALDPDYEDNGFIWVYHTAPGDAANYPENRVVRFREANGVGSDPEIMLRIPITNGQLLHNGGNLHFDADGYLYVSIGDYGDTVNANDLETLPGKIHRFAVTENGLQPAEDNPFEDNSIYAYGLRNPFDFTIDSETGAIFATENGLHCDDEVNRIRAGFDYGWREDYSCIGADTVPPGINLYGMPLLSYTPAIAPTGIVVYRHEAVPEWQGELFFCSWNTGILRRVTLNERQSRVEEVRELDLGEAGCKIDIEVAPDGSIYFIDVIEGTSIIYRLTPLNE